MRALIISSEFPPGPGGIGTHAHELARGLTERDWSITVLTRQDYTSGAEAGEFNRGLEFELLGMPRERSKRSRAARAVARRSIPDVVIASGATPVWLATTIGRPAKRVAIAHGTELTAGSASRRALTRHALRRMDGIVCVSQHTRDVMRSVGIETERQAVIPNGADPQRFRPLAPDRIAATLRDLAVLDSPTEIEEPGGRALLLTVGHVSRRKAQDVVIRALPAIVARRPDVLYVIAGLPTLRAEYEELSRELGVEDHVRFLGQVDPGKLPALYGACDIFLLVSRTEDGDFEGYGIAAVEAALCGRPTIASLGSGLSEAVLNEETGLLVPPNDPDATARAVIRLLEEDGLAARLGRAAFERARREQTWPDRIEAYDEFLREVVRS